MRSRRMRRSSGHGSRTRGWGLETPRALPTPHTRPMRLERRSPDDRRLARLRESHAAKPGFRAQAGAPRKSLHIVVRNSVLVSPDPSQANHALQPELSPPPSQCVFPPPPVHTPQLPPENADCRSRLLAALCVDCTDVGWRAISDCAGRNSTKIGTTDMLHCEESNCAIHGPMWRGRVSAAEGGLSSVRNTGSVASGLGRRSALSQHDSSPPSINHFPISIAVTWPPAGHMRRASAHALA